MDIETKKARYEALRAAAQRGASRWEHLAYSFLRGTPYRCVELKTHENNHAYSWDALCRIYDALHGTRTTWWQKSHVEKSELTKDILAWVQVPADPVVVASVEKVRQAYLEAKRRRAEAVQAERCSA